MDVTGDESEYEMLYCVHDMLSLYCRHHELIYGHVSERIGPVSYTHLTLPTIA